MKSSYKKQQLIILGNGFDIQCGLKSTYKDFFNKRFKEVFGSVNSEVSYKDLEQQYNSIKHTISELIGKHRLHADIFSELIKRLTLDGAKNITRWDFYLLATNYLLHDGDTNILWRDVETDIYIIVTALLTHEYNTTNKNLRSDEDKNNTDIKKVENFIEDLIWLDGESGRSEDGKYDEERAEELLKELIIFEKVFAEFIKKQMTKHYYSNVVNILNDLYKNSDLHKEIARCSVLSFNYSMDKNRVTGESWSWNNIHGIANYKDIASPIFGIDNHDIVSLSKKDGVSQDPRTLFTKAYRVIDNDIDQIQQPIDFSGIKLISFYGHSLGEADYSYFETIFDDVDLYNSNVELEFYYYIKDNPILDKREAIRKIENLLVNYGNQLDQVHGENIMNKLILEKRIRIIPTIKLLHVKEIEERRKAVNNKTIV